MKTLNKTTLLALIVAASIACVPSAFALTYGNNITKWDGEGVTNEDNEVEIGMEATQKWDLEGFFLKGNVLTMIGGFDFKNGVSGYPNYKSGDIFISKDSTYGAPIGDPVAGDGLQNVNNNYGYEYALSVNWSTLAFNVYNLDPTDTTTTVWYNQNQTGTATSNPWKYNAGGTLVGSGFGTGGGQVGSLVASEYGLSGWGTDNNHYAVSFDLSSVIAAADLYGKDFYTHFTMGCGNDNLIGQGTAPVPEPGTMMLLGFGILGLAVYGKRRMNKEA
ncbi:MAG: PEP-CTERM sorting domain-containing protein [Desulfuromonadaceae bacterium]